MSVFFIALTAVAVLLATAVPGYLLAKRKMVSEECIPGFSKVLLYVCQPCLTVYSFRTTTYTPDLLGRVGIFALLCLVIQGVMLASAFLVFRHKYKEPVYRIITVATTFGNCAFFGIPIIEALLPEMASDLILYTAVYSFVMNLIGWTVASAIITGDTKYINFKKVVCNPTVFGMAAAMILFIGKVPLPDKVEDMITLIARMSTPLSMLIMGMRLATMKLETVFTQPRAYMTIGIKQFLMPLLAFLFMLIVPVDVSVKQTFFIICACPVASVVLNYSEILGAGQEDAAVMLLLGTMSSIVTLPIVVLLLPLL